MSSEMTLRDGILTISLPEHFCADNRQDALQLASGCTEPYRALRLDASRTISIDGAAIGTLARLVRLARNETGGAPILVNPSGIVVEVLRKTMLLQLFEVQAEAGGG